MSPIETLTLKKNGVKQPSHTMKRFGEKLRALRLQRGLTLKELAAALGHAAHGHLSELEAGKKVPMAEFVVNVAQLFQVTTDQLLNDELAIVSIGPQTTREESVGPLPLIERLPTPNEVEKLRLILSTYQDGTGMIQLAGNATLPGWRDFERATALAFGGEAQESKAIFDVLLADEQKPTVKYGISCKMRRELNRVQKHGRALLELSNSAGQFWQRLAAKGVTQANYKEHASRVGQTLIEVVESWHQAVSIEQGGVVDSSRSCFLVLSWSNQGWYQLHQFPLRLPDFAELTWYFPRHQRTGEIARRLNGDYETGTLFEWYGESGGQLKYYPQVESAVWASPLFQLEPLQNAEYGILQKAAAYFPEKWAQLTH